MGVSSKGRNLRVVIGVVFVVWVMCLAGAVVVGIIVTRNSRPKDIIAATGIPVTEAAIQVSPPEAYSGTELTVNGRDWRPGDVIFVRLQSPTGAADETYAYAGAVADDAGQFVVKFSYPYESRWLEADSVQIVARSEASNVQAVTALRVVRPVEQPTPTQLVTVAPPTRPAVPTPGQPLQPGAPTLPPPPAPPPPPPPPPVPVITDWMGVYYTNPDLQGQPAMIRNDREVNFEWGMGGPTPNFPTDNFSVQWTRNLNFEGGNYRFVIRVDDGARLWVDDRLLIDQWHDSGPMTYAAEVYLNPGGHKVRLDYFERIGWAVCQLQWQRLEANYPDWKGEYFSNPNVSGSPVLARNDPWIDFKWGEGSPGPGVPADDFSARWTRDLSFGAGDYRFYVAVKDGVRLWIDNQLVMDQWHDSDPVTYATDRSLGAGNHNLRMQYYNRSGAAEAHLWWERAQTTYPDWKGEYFSNKKLQGTPVLVKNDPAIDFDWGTDSPADEVPSNDFSVRWTRQQKFDKSGPYSFYARVNDGMRLWVDDELVIDQWNDGATRVVSGTRDISKGTHDIRVEYYDKSDTALINLWWGLQGATVTPSLTLTRPPVPSATSQPAAPSIALSPPQGVVGTSIVVNGAGWPAEQNVSLSLAKTQPGTASVQIDPKLSAVTVTTGPDGKFQAGIVLPAGQGWEGLPDALVVAFSADFSKTAVARFALAQGGAVTPEKPVPTKDPTQLPPEKPTEAAQPTQGPTEAAQPTQSPTAAPEATQAPTEAVPPSATPAEAVQPTAAPAEPTITPVPPTAAPVEPTDTPVPPTAVPVEPTHTAVPPTPEPKPTDTPEVAPTAAPQAAPWVLSVTPVSGTVGITLTVMGEGWPAGGSVEFVLARPVVDGQPQFTVPVTGTVGLADPSGKFVVPVWLPAEQGWESVPQALIVAQTQDKKREASAAYTIIAAPAPQAPPVELPQQ